MPTASGGARPDIVLVTLDTTRADRIGAYGYADAKTESIDALANQGIRFNQAVSPMPLTIPAHSVIMTGLLPFHTGVRANGDNVLADSFTTLAEVLKGKGWRTAASVAAFVTTRQWGFNQGFDAYFDSMPEEETSGPANRNFWHNERAGDLVVDDALTWLSGQPAEAPVFLWVHLYDAHFPYELHEAQGETFKARPYDGELAYVDDQVGRLVSAFSGRDVLWVLVGDHGESLGEHQEAQHGLYNYAATQHVPFIVSGHGVKPLVVSDAVSTADVMPTILRMVGIDPPSGLDGTPQPGSADVPYAESYQLADRFKLAPHRTVVAEGHKLIDTPRPELYDLAADPGEQTNIAEAHPELVTKLRALLAKKGATPPGKSGATMDADTLAQLSALGYVAPTDADALDYASLPDPKDFKEFLGKVNRLEHISKTEGPEAALAVLDEAIAERPEAFELHIRKIGALTRLKRTDEARAYSTELTNKFPQNPRVWLAVATSDLKDGDLTHALESAERALTIDPTLAAAQETVMEALIRLRREDEAVTRGTTWMKDNPKNYGVAALMGLHYLKKSQYPEAERFLRVAISGPNPRRAARAQLAVLAVVAGQPEEARHLLEAEVKDYPGNIFARRALEKLYGDAGRWLDQKVQLEFLLRALPKEVGVRLALAQCQFNLEDYAAARRTLDPARDDAPNDPFVLLLHANLLAKEGKRDEGFVIFQRAEKLQKEQDLRAEKAAKAAAPKDPKNP